MTGGRGYDSVVPSLEMATTQDHATIPAYDRVDRAARFEWERPHSTRNVITAYRTRGIVPVIGVQGRFVEGSVGGRS